ncbi:hypothetical protein GE061_013258 [Apolygus lucorum]|uniref:Uncharacterized protein n=1 Tax=Apolygus lucorum TaxID=248454 RepID=A0A8S9XQ39_APOLU|nr:hypothetical protein GE061_013258 [Apolygus lucorum]
MFRERQEKIPFTRGSGWQNREMRGKRKPSLYSCQINTMGARNSKRSVDISAASKKDKPESNSAEKLERIEEPEIAKQNGTTTPRPEESQEASGDATTQVNGDDTSETKESDDKAEKKDDETEKKEPQTPESPVEEAKSPEEEKSEKKKKDKSKKKWSFRSISFSRKDKTKPNMSKDDSITSDLSKVADAVAEVVEGETAAVTEENKEEVKPAVAGEDKKKEEEKEPLAAPLTSALSSIAAAATTAVEEIKEKVEEKKEEVKSEVVTKGEEIIEEGKSVVQKTLEQVVEKTSSFVESSTSSVITTVTESSQIITSSSQVIQEVMEIKSEESPAPPLPASPPPTEAPPPTPNVVSQPEPEEVNGGGEGMAEMPEENGLGSDAKIDDVDDEEELPKLNGHSEISPVKQVEDIIDAIKSEAIEKSIIAETNGELVTTNDAAE